MKDIKCPSCGKTFQIDPSSFEEILHQIKDEEFNKQIKERLQLAEEDNKKSIEIQDEYKFGWSIYSEITNGRFAMIGFLAIILIELFSKQSFLKWAGIL